MSRKLVVPASKPRNSAARTLRNCRAAVHGKTFKAQRREDRVSLQRGTP